MEDQLHQFQIRVGDGAAWIGEADQLPDDVSRLLHFPGKVNAVSILVYPDPPGALYWGICVAYVICGPVENIG